MTPRLCCHCGLLADAPIHTGGHPERCHVFEAKPRRIQLSRRKGWRLPAGAVVVSRPSKWGNPFRPGDLDCDGVSPMTRSRVVGVYEIYLRAGQLLFTLADVQRELRGKDLACWCPLPGLGESDVCHAAVLLRVAAEEPRR